MRVSGLQKAPELNGGAAIVLERIESRDRYLVRVAERGIVQEEAMEGRSDLQEPDPLPFEPDGGIHF